MNAAATQSTRGLAVRPRWPSPAWEAASAPLRIRSWLWQRLDVPGRDACQLYRIVEGGWRLAGTAVFLDGRRTCTLDYRLDCDPRWRAIGGSVVGRLPEGPVDLHLRRVGTGAWLCNGRALELALPCVDLDFGFTPASNLAALRRLRLAQGRQAQTVALWLDLPAAELKPLVQCYQRTGPRTYAYAAPAIGYSGTLTVDAGSGIAEYPGLFRRIA